MTKNDPRVWPTRMTFEFDLRAWPKIMIHENDPRDPRDPRDLAYFHGGSHIKTFFKKMNFRHGIGEVADLNQETQFRNTMAWKYNV